MPEVPSLRLERTDPRRSRLLLAYPSRVAGESVQLVRMLNFLEEEGACSGKNPTNMFLMPNEQEARARRENRGPALYEATKADDAGGTQRHGSVAMGEATPWSIKG